MGRKDLTKNERNQVVQFLLEGSQNGVLVRGRIQAATIKFAICRKTVSRYWAASKKMQANGEAIYLQSAKMNPRRKRVQIDLQFIANLDLLKRSSIRALAIQVGCSKSTVGKWIKQGLIKAHTSPLRPDLTAPNKLLRLKFSLEALELDRILNTLTFRSMQNIVHIDEKWFYITKGTHRFYMTAAETEPHRTCKNKKFITKVMFMCAVCRPLFGPDGSVQFDGKIGIFPFTQRVPAVRASKNRPAGTMETKAIDSVTKEVVRECLINKILPAIKQKWPPFASKTIYIQQDNARPHIKDSDQVFRNAATQDGFNFTLVQQPPNSPDTNVNDLGWFRAIQSLQLKTACRTVDELIGAVHKSFEELSPISLNNVFLSLQGCMVEIMKVKGQNCYKIPHMGKDALIRAGALPLNLEVSVDLVRECLNYLVEAGNLDGVGGLMNALGIHNLGNEQ